MAGELRSLTVIFPYYENPQMLQRHYRHFSGMPRDVRSRIKLVIVDDGSPTHPATPADPGVELSIYRMLVDVRWNQDACRNLGVHVARTEWLLLTDIDHLIPVQTIRAALDGDLNPRIAYQFTRIIAPTMRAFRPHPNSWLLTRDLFQAAGGYDERFAGFYGTDGEFTERLTAAALSVERLPVPLILVTPSVTPDSWTTRYGRKEPADKEAIPRILAERARLDNWRTVQLSFPWRKVHDVTTSEGSSASWPPPS